MLSLFCFLFLFFFNQVQHIFILQATPSTFHLVLELSIWSIQKTIWVVSRIPHRQLFNINTIQSPTPMENTQQASILKLRGLKNKDMFLPIFDRVSINSRTSTGGDVFRELWLMIFQMFGVEWIMPKWVVWHVGIGGWPEWQNYCLECNSFLLILVHMGRNKRSKLQWSRENKHGSTDFSSQNLIWVELCYRFTLCLAM